MAQTETVFSHAPLDLAKPDTIRLIEVLPRLLEDGTIQCRLTHATTDARYSCLSYVWGPEDVEYTIYINDLPFKVRTNLFRFLLKASSNLPVRTGGIRENASLGAARKALWIDALCIDQQNTSERNHQVQQMGQIYMRSKRTIAWLGDDAFYPSLFHDAEPLSDDDDEDGDDNEDDDDEDDDDEDDDDEDDDDEDDDDEDDDDEDDNNNNNNNNGDNDDDDDDTRGPLFLDDAETLITFCNNVYWQRAWITQELLLATNISFCGFGNAVDLRHLRSSFQETMAGVSRAYGYSKFQAVYDILEREEQCTLIENLWRFRRKQCLDRRDLIYSLLSISRISLQFEVDYNIKLPDLALRVLQSLGDEFCLCSAKIVLQTLQVLDEFSNAIERPFATVRLLPPLQSSDRRCIPCDSDPLEKIAANHFPLLETQFHCLGCVHPDSRIQPTDHYTTFLHGHLALRRQRSVLNHLPFPEYSWHAYWIPPFQSGKRRDPRGPLEGIKVLQADRDGYESPILQISFKLFVEWASVPFEAEFRRKSPKSGKFTRWADHEYKADDVQNLKWKLLAQDKILLGSPSTVA
jgi:hypothetical protein